jgi:DNA repair protein RecN (Recombination protein N)
VISVLDELFISNIGGLASAELKFSGRFIAITGESGAGKSSVVRAIELISGKRGQASLIRHGSENANARATFLPSNTLSLPDGISAEDNILYISRTISRNGKGRNSVQDRPVPLSTLSGLMENQIRIQSQFAQLDLLSRDKQLSIVDSCGGEELQKLLGKLKTSFTEALDLDKKIRDIKERQSLVLKKYKDAENIVEELEKINPFPDCNRKWNEELEQLQKKINSSRKLKDLLLKLKGTELEGGILDTLQTLMTDLCSLSTEKERSEWNGLFSKTMENASSLIELAEQKNRLERLQEMEENFDKTEAKLGLLRKLMRKAGVASVKNLMDYCDKAGKELAWLSESYREIDEMEQKNRELRKTASDLAMKIRKRRKNCAERLVSRVNWVMGELAMMGLEFDIEVKELGKLRANGADEVSFVLRTPEGTSGPVNKISSGGELSRILLAIQVSLPDEELPETIVFDEVEAGLGGRAAVLAGYKLKQLSEKCQVILITHEASIASIADSHFVIRKEGTESEIQEVNGEDRVTEIARMLSGDFNLSEARDHARRLLNEERADIPGILNML